MGKKNTTNRPQPLKNTKLSGSSRSDLWFYPGEELADGEMRVTLMGTGWGNVVNPAQKGPSVFVELGNDAKSSFVFDLGPGCILNYNAMEVPMSRMNHVFLSHLHMDHCSDLPFVYAFGPNLGDRYTPLNIYGPSGPEWPPKHGEHSQDAEARRVLGTRNLVEGMKRFTQWHTTSFATMTSGAESSYELQENTKVEHDDNIHEFDYRCCLGPVFERHDKGHGHIRIRSFPALHIIDGAVSYRIEWTPVGEDQPIVMVYSGDTLPNEFMLEYGKRADLLIHETAPSISSVMNGANVSQEKADDIVNNSHTPAENLGYIFKHTRPRLGVTTHTPMDPRSVGDMVTDVSKNWDGPYQIGADLMVFNVNKDDDIRIRMGAPVDRAWPTRIEQAPSDEPPLEDQQKYLRKAVSEGAHRHLDGVIFSHELDEPKSTEKQE